MHVHSRIIPAAALLWLLSAFSSPPEALGQDHTAPRIAAVDAAGAAYIQVIARAGDLRIEGRPGLTEVRIQGTARAPRRELLEEVELLAVREGDRVLIEARLPENRFGYSTRLDLSVEVPAHLPLEVEDSSGDVEVTGTATLLLEDSSGDVLLRRIGGPLRLSDSSGGIDITDAAGPVRIDDASGDIRIREARGDVIIEDDSSGDIDIAGVRGDVHIEEDSSGDIAITEVAGNVTVGDDSSGDITVAEVRGSLTVEDDTSGRIRHRNIGGAVRIPSE